VISQDQLDCNAAKEMIEEIQRSHALIGDNAYFSWVIAIRKIKEEQFEKGRNRERWSTVAFAVLAFTGGYLCK